MWLNAEPRYLDRICNYLKKIFNAIVNKGATFLENIKSDPATMKRSQMTSEPWKICVEQIHTIQIPLQEDEYNSYHYQIKPILLMMRIFGALPIQISKAGVPRFRLRSYVVLYTVCLWIFIIFTSYSNLCDRIYDYIMSTDNHLSVSTILHIFAVTHMPVVIITTASDVNSFIQYMKIWVQFQEMFNRVTKERLVLSVRRLCIYCDIFCCVAALGTLFIHFCPPYVSLINMPSYICLAAVTSILKCLWLCTYKCLGNTSSSLVSYFKEDLQRKCDRAQVIEDYRILWLRLSQLVSETGGATGKIFCLYHVYSMFTLALSTYAALSGFRNIQENLLRIVLMSSVTLISGIPFYCLCNNAEHLTHNVVRGIQQELELIRSNGGHDWILQEVNTFQLTIISNPPTISVYGFTDANKRLFKGYVSALVTYLIVLLQFDIEEPEHKSALNSTHTST